MQIDQQDGRGRFWGFSGRAGVSPEAQNSHEGKRRRRGKKREKGKGEGGWERR